MTAEVGVKVIAHPGPGRRPFGDAARRAHAATFAGDPAWRQTALDWITAFWAAHGHGPTWSQLRHAAELWPADVPQNVRLLVLPMLALHGWLDGTKTPYGLKVHPRVQAGSDSRMPQARTASPDHTVAAMPR